MKKTPSSLLLAIAIIGSFTLIYFAENISSMTAVQVAYAQSSCEEDPAADGCPCTGQDQVGTQPNCVCYNETNPECVDYNYCAAFPLSDQCNQTCSNQTYHDAHLSECGTCADAEYENTHPEECAAPTYCCTACSAGSPSYQNTNYNSNPVDPAQCNTNACITGTDICVQTVEGCTDNTASNYNASANQDDGSCYWNASCSVDHEFNVDYSGVNPSVSYYGTYNISNTWNAWPVQPDTSWCTQVVNSGDSEQYIVNHAPELQAGSSCGTDCSILNISHSDACPEGQIRNGSDICVDAETDCANNGGIWVSADQTCHFPAASCGTAANSSPASTPPESNFCEEGTASLITTNANTFDWTCTSSDELLTVSCSTERYSSEGNNITTTGCGLANGSNPLDTPTEGLCANSNSLLGEVSFAPNTYSWTCVNDNTSVQSSCSAAKLILCEGTDVICQGVCVPPGTCSCPSCSGTASTTLINTFSLEPRFVSSSTVPCYIDWSANIAKDGENDIGGCAINGQYVISSSTSPAPYLPGVYTLFCQTGTEFQTRTIRCSVNPEIKEN